MEQSDLIRNFKNRPFWAGICFLALAGLTFVLVSGISQPEKKQEPLRKSANTRHLSENFPLKNSHDKNFHSKPFLQTQADVLNAVAIENSEHLALARWNEIRNMPGAAEIADEIADYLKTDGAEDFSFSELEATADETGMVEVGELTLDSVIKDEKIRAKFQQLMQMVQNHSKND